MTAVLARLRVVAPSAGSTSRAVVGAWLSLWLVAPLAFADQQQPRVVQHAYTLLHQSAREAVQLVLPLLSPGGGVEVRAGSNTLVIRDTAERLSAILPVLRAFDHEPRPLELSLRLVQVEGPAVISPPGAGLPANVLAQLQRHLPFRSFYLLSETRLVSREQEEVAFSLGELYHVRFSLGTILGGKRLRLYDFEVRGREEAAPPLVRASLNVWLGRTLALGLPADTESGAMLLVVLTCREPLDSEEE